MSDEPAPRLAFSLALLAAPAEAPKPMSGCSRGHLRVAERSCWRPVFYDTTLRTLLHEAVDDCDG